MTSPSSRSLHRYHWSCSTASPGAWSGALTALSVIVTVAAISAYQSRTAVVAMLLGMAVVVVLSKPQGRVRFLRIGAPAVLLLVLLSFVYALQSSHDSILHKFLYTGLHGRTATWVKA